MPTDLTRAMSLQQQLALEIIADQSAQMAASLFDGFDSEVITETEVNAMASAYGTLLLGAMLAVASTRLGYLQEVTEAEGQVAFEVPDNVLQPTVRDVLVGPNAPELPVSRGVGAGLPSMHQFAAREPSPEGGMWAALARLEKNLRLNEPDALVVARNDLIEYTESTAHATADWVDRMVLNPDRRVSALRRVAHPTACDRCLKVSGALVFKERPRLRHPQCKCSFEPVFLTDEDYMVRLAKYRANVEDTTPGRRGADRRERGRQQEQDAKFREESVFLEDAWRDFLRAEQKRIADVVQTVPSTQYRDWAVMTSVKITEADSDSLPVLTRE